MKKEPSPVKRGINVSLQKKKGTKRKSEQTQSKAKSVKRTKTETASTAERAKEVAGNSFKLNSYKTSKIWSYKREANCELSIMAPSQVPHDKSTFYYLQI